MSKIIVIAGPTGVGKTKLSIDLAKKYDAVIINADATQVYQEANIGTAKVTEKETCGVPHYMIDIVPLSTNYTVCNYQKDGRKILDKLIKENKNIIIVGGSGLYIKALLYDYKFDIENNTSDKDYSKFSNEELKSMVDSIYEENNIHVNNRKRLERFLNHYENTGNIIKNSEEKDTPLYDFTIIGLTTSKEKLYYHLEKRVYDMLINGFIEEAYLLKHYPKVRTFIGYGELIKYKEKKCTLTDAVEEIISKTKKYAKRQYTWFNNQFDNIKWFNVDYNDFENTEKEVIDYLENL